MTCDPATAKLVENVDPVPVPCDPPPDQAYDVTVTPSGDVIVGLQTTVTPTATVVGLHPSESTVGLPSVTNNGWISAAQLPPLHAVSWTACWPGVAKLVENVGPFAVAAEPSADH